METLKNIIRNSNMSTRPEFYSGRGAILCDLNGEILQKIYIGIENQYGKRAANNYVKMVADIKILSATTFLQELYSLFNSNFKYIKKKNHANGIAIQKNNDGDYDGNSVAMGMVSIFESLSNNRDDTQMIKNGFLVCHGIKPNKTMVDCYNNVIIYNY
jgi:hypothetical protein